MFALLAFVAGSLSFTKASRRSEGRSGTWISQGINIVVATENNVDAYIAGTRQKLYGSANLVMTLERRGRRFPTFFTRLFKMMFDGETSRSHG